jgi:hypothetical protein
MPSFLFENVRIFHRSAVAILINQIVKRDRLPQSNSLQAQQLLRNAVSWQHFLFSPFIAFVQPLVH